MLISDFISRGKVTQKKGKGKKNRRSWSVARVQRKSKFQKICHYDDNSEVERQGKKGSV